MAILPVTERIMKYKSHGSLSNRQAHQRMYEGGTKNPLVKLVGIVDNEVLIIAPKRYTVPAGTDCLYCSNKEFPDHLVNINYIVEDGYTCIVVLENCDDTIINVRPGFDNDDVIIIYKNQLLNKQAASKVLTTWDSE